MKSDMKTMESEMIDVKENLSVLTDSAQISKAEGKLSSPILLVNFGVYFDLKRK